MTKINALNKKSSSSNTITIQTKKTNNNTTSTPTAKPVQDTKIKAPKVRPHKKPKIKVRQHPQQQQPQFNLSDFKLATSGDSSSVHIHTLHQGNPIHKFSLIRSDYQLWQRMGRPALYDWCFEALKC